MVFDYDAANFAINYIRNHFLKCFSFKCRSTDIFINIEPAQYRLMLLSPMLYNKLLVFYRAGFIFISNRYQVYLPLGANFLCVPCEKTSRGQTLQCRHISCSQKACETHLRPAKVRSRVFRCRLICIAIFLSSASNDALFVIYFFSSTSFTAYMPFLHFSP